MQSFNVFTMRTSYTRLFDEVTNLYCEVGKRIVIGNKIINKERVRAGEDYLNAVAVYEVHHGKITRVTFIKPTE